MTQKLLAEFLGTFALVFCGTGAIIINDQSGGTITHVGIGLVFGLTVMAMIYAFGDISRAHFNPAVTLAFCLSGRLPVQRVPPYIFSQLAGALLASATLKMLFVNHQTLGSTVPSRTTLQSFVLEFITSFFLMLVIINVATGSKERGMFAGLAIGFTVLLEALFAGPVSGASMNPARSIAPALVSGHLDKLWIYIAAPIAGAVLAIPIHRILHLKTPSYADRPVQ
jgi:aquaporin NIP